MSRILNTINMALYSIQSYICRKQTIYAVHTKLIQKIPHTFDFMAIISNLPLFRENRLYSSTTIQITLWEEYVL